MCNPKINFVSGNRIFQTFLHNASLTSINEGGFQSIIDARNFVSDHYQGKMLQFVVMVCKIAS